MIRAARKLIPPAPPGRRGSPSPRPKQADSSATSGGASPYGLTFWLCYAANTLLTLAMALLFRYADFIVFLRGNELDLGLIVGFGMVGAIAVRLVQGLAIDRYGPSKVWLLSLAIFAASAAAHPLVGSAHGPAVYLARLGLTIGLAGAFGASITFISLMVPPARVAEMIGMLGSAGFIGIGLGPVLGDWLFNVLEAPRQQVNWMFTLAAVMAAFSFLCTALATRGEVHAPRRLRIPLFALLRRYQPGSLLVIAAAMGIGVTLPHTFLRAYAMRLGVADIKSYFLVYAGTAFAVRIATRQFPQRHGIRLMVLVGMSALAVGMLLMLTVQSEWMFAIPAVAGGVAHAFLFPAVVGGGSLSFPMRYRGLATTLILALFDVGTLVGQPAAGAVIELAAARDLPPYATLFISVAAVMALAAGGYAYATRQRRA